MLIRHATPADLPAIVALERQAATAAHWSSGQYQAVFLDSAPRRIVLVLEETSTIQAFLIARTLDQEWEIENVVVSDRVQRRGLGSRLLDEFLALARGQGATAVFLEVRESNRAARALYGKASLVHTGRRKHYYREPEEDALVYRLVLA